MKSPRYRVLPEPNALHWVFKAVAFLYPTDREWKGGRQKVGRERVLKKRSTAGECSVGTDWVAALKHTLDQNRLLPSD